MNLVVLALPGVMFVNRDFQCPGGCQCVETKEEHAPTKVSLSPVLF